MENRFRLWAKPVTASVEAYIESRLESLPTGLFNHIHRVRDIALDLAELHGLDVEKTRLGALAHDLARAADGEELLRQAKDLGIHVHPVEERVPILLHGPVAAENLRRNGLDDPEVYQAVYWHSTAHPELPDVAKAVFLADKLDPSKQRRYPFIDSVMSQSRENMDTAILTFLDRELIRLLEMGELVHPASVDARNDLLARSL